MTFRDLHRFFSSHPLSTASEAWTRFISWQISCRLREEVVFPWVEGQRLIVRRGMTGATGNIYVGLHEFPDMMFLLHLLREGDLFVDVGANVGSYTILASGVCGARTWAFEPDAEAARYLWRNVETNRLEYLVTLHEAALGGCDDDVQLTVGLDTTNRVVTGRAGGTTLVRQMVLDKLATQQEPLLVKIDVEGYEEDVIKGCTSLLSNTTLKALEIETVTPWIESLLRNAGFERSYYDPFQRKLCTESMYTAANSLFVRDPDFVAERLTTAKPIELFGRKI